MYSAVKVNGQPLYKAARAGKTVERTPRPVTLHSIMLAGSPAPNEYILNIHCSKGTYVRVLLEDIGRALGVPATMAALRRTASGPYTLEMAYTLDELQRAREAGTLESLLLSVESVFTCLPAVEVNEETRRRLLNGAPTYRFPARDGRYRALCEGEFLGVCRVEKHILTVEKLFWRTRVTRPAGGRCARRSLWGLLSRARERPALKNGRCAFALLRYSCDDRGRHGRLCGPWLF